MQLLIIGFDEEETRELSRLLRAEGHAVLGAQGRHGARTFIHAVTPDAIVVPEGARGDNAMAWLADLPLTPRYVALQVEPAAGANLDALLRGEVQPAAARPGDGDDAASSPTDGAPAAFEEEAPDVHAVVAEVDERDDDDGALEDDDDSDDDLAPVEILVAPPPLPARPETRRSSSARPRSAPSLAELADTEPEPEPPRELHPELAQKLAQVRLGDYFSIVEVEPNASTWAIREACERLGRRYAPRGWAHRLSPEELEAMDEIARGIADALMVLGDEELRTRYQRALAAAAQGVDPSHASR